VELCNRQMLVNGVPVLIKGVNRHEHDDRRGKTLTMESMLQDIYTEYSEEVFGYLLRRVDLSMGAPRVVELLVRGYYEYITNHKEEFSFIEQFSNCPSLVRRCSESGSMSTVYNLVAEMKRKHMVRNYNNDTLFAIIFHPVKAIAADDRRSESERDVLLQEIIGMVQDAILI